MATIQIYFLFLTYKVKYNIIILKISNQKNTYSMTIIIRDVIKLYKIMKCEKEVHYKIFVFLMLYNRV